MSPRIREHDADIRTATAEPGEAHQIVDAHQDVSRGHGLIAIDLLSNRLCGTESAHPRFAPDFFGLVGGRDVERAYRLEQRERYDGVNLCGRGV